MEAREDKRNHQRYEHQGPLNLYRMDHQDLHSYAEMNDYSQGGVSIMTNEKLVINQIVYLEMRNLAKSFPDPEKQKGYNGIVR